MDSEKIWCLHYSLSFLVAVSDFLQKFFWQENIHLELDRSLFEILFKTITIEFFFIMWCMYAKKLIKNIFIIQKNNFCANNAHPNTSVSQGNVASLRRSRRVGWGRKWVALFNSITGIIIFNLVFSFKIHALEQKKA